MLKQNRLIDKVLRTTHKKEYNHELVKRLLKYSKINRNKWTFYERCLNGWLCNWGVKHQNQAIFPPYIVDILLTDYKVILELDGAQHEFNTAYDRKRDLHLMNLGYKVIRIKNTDMNDKQYIKTVVLKAIE